MKTLKTILTMVLFLAAGAAAVLAIINGDLLIAWVITLCIVFYGIKTAYDTISDQLSLLIRFATLKLAERLEEIAQTEGRTYTQADLVKFGKYILSEQREQSIECKENIREVTDADIANAFEK